ncbi:MULTISPECIES: thiamine-phosphate kinase [Prochlorococcus]|uniref:Thiamine-monophosphate kinase n=1 Tax=Prochlorococcus marinus (strain SARG / CCMP1375 / SS120) TaxID=167539 RepID=THIL_PROMA|nr:MULTISPECIES: thiamine-phosphate kinase [Prochlorococcus]Q7VEI9.1 RecName: Full=Thiamine-monophosphate kinase; Short=TMP kinase; Short=Thiamine-phosphate kinase [Prochlorococcus marinus subsp. marinus str. CCMP1375]AAP99070.1 Thiamine monophosphate kinase [Prochlorococcus marinus subsp. marinus str. CCMP1375]KGG11673.1 Thiamine-monophosphate kinase [Prochlorococcus marinus str. LG]KGG22318.1 Thiamine-monophosphate kinase [Prochlorococcus marinus str. SS2]KGG22655.1 Thiamine-monophosphate ki
MLKEENTQEILHDLGEQEILNRLRKYMDYGQIDDDTALIKSYKKELIINTDMLVEDVHFSEITTNPNHIGWKAVATNLSDLACSGLEEVIGITVGLSAPSSTPWSWVDGVYTGIKAALNKFGGKLLGGDCSNGKQKTLCITALGTKGPLNLHRSNARPGDYLITSGPHGLSRLGLSLLLSDPITKSINVPNLLKEHAIKAHQEPQPPIKALQTLLKCKPYAMPWNAAATDSSDGLLEAIESLCRSSNCTAVVDHKNLPKHADWPSGKQWNDWCLEGGEDFELVVSLPPNWAKAWLKAMPCTKAIGRMKEGPAKAMWSNGETIQKAMDTKFEHF